jgi:membrane protease YdiL (CAAX protease family)
MTADLRATLIKVILPFAGIVVVLVMAKLRKLDLQEVVGLRLPSAQRFALWIAIWIAWMAISELVLQSMHMEQPAPWRAYAPLIVALRILAIGILGPIAEELIFRGLLFGRLAPRIGAVVTIVLLAAGWSLIHLPNGYQWTTIALIFIDGLILGFARKHTGSVYVPIAMHILGNLYSIYQSLS